MKRWAVRGELHLAWRMKIYRPRDRVFMWDEWPQFFWGRHRVMWELAAARPLPASERRDAALHPSCEEITS
jgi:hypothetical protein